MMPNEYTQARFSQRDEKECIREGCTIVVPAYNESQGIEDVIRYLRSIEMGREFEIIIVDDGSKDNTAEIAREYASEGVTIVQHPINMGYGAALKTGIRHARYNAIAIIDADGTYPANRLPEMMKDLCEHGYDMVVGARVTSNVRIPLVRKPAKWALNQFANYMVGTKIPDLNSGMRVFRKEVAMDYFNILPSGFSFTTTITLALLSRGYLVKYTPIDYFARKGKSKIRPIQDTINFFALVSKTVLYYNPLRVFLPAGLLFFIAALIRGGFNAIVYHDLTTADLLLFVTGVQIISTGLLADLVSRRVK